MTTIVMEKYIPEEYWTEVAERIEKRNDNRTTAGDDEPFYTYKRNNFLKLLLTLNIQDKSILEVGCGPGGNLEILKKLKPQKLAGVDISQKMIDLAKTRCSSTIELTQINGSDIPYKNNTFDTVFTATVLQHITDDNILKSLIKSMSEVSKENIIIFERIETKRKIGHSNIGRTITEYKNLFSACNFKLTRVTYININASYYMAGIIRKVFNQKSHKEGERETHATKVLQKILLPITKVLDGIWKAKRDLAKLEFTKHK